MPRPSPASLHALMVLLSDGENPRCLHAWQEDLPAPPPQSGEIAPLPDFVVAAGASVEPAALVESVFAPADLPEAVKAVLPADAAAGCERVIVLRTLSADNAVDGFVELGAFEPMEAKRILRLLEDYEVPFELEADHSALMQPARFVAQQLGLNPVGSRVKLYVPEDSAELASQLLNSLYPGEKPPPRRVFPSGGGGNATPVHEVYAAPAADLMVDEGRDFYSDRDEPPAKPNG